MVAWLTYRGEKLVVVEASREWAQKVPYGSVAKMKHETNRLSVFSKFFPARAAKITNYLSSRKCRPAIAHLPKPPVRVVDVIPDVGGIVLAWSSDTYGWYVGTPSGWIKLNSWISRRIRPGWRCVTLAFRFRTSGISGNGMKKWRRT